jgi:hypothetical protein
MIRLTRFHAVNFRSLGDVRLDALPEVVLLYEENDVGKSNILRAVGAWLKLVAFMLHWSSERGNSERGRADALRVDPEDGTSKFHLVRESAESVVGRPVQAQFHHEQTRMQLAGRLRVSLPGAGAGATFEFEFSFQLTLVNAAAASDEMAVAVTLDRVEWPGSGPLRDAIPASDPALIALRAALSDPWLWISSERRFHPELRIPPGQARPQAG